MDYQNLVDEYLRGAELLRDAVKGMTEAELDAKPIAGKWSTRQVVCHVVDFEPIYADRMKRVIAEEFPTFFAGDPDTFASRLAYERREVNEELDLLTAVRRHMARILRGLTEENFQRTGNHSESGPLTLEALLTNITKHVPHHVRFIIEKRKALESTP